MLGERFLLLQKRDPSLEPFFTGYDFMHVGLRSFAVVSAFLKGCDSVGVCALCVEQQLHIPPQMIETFGCDCGASLRFRQNEAALDHRLDVKRETFWRPGSTNATVAHRRADVGFKRLGVAADIPFASGAYIRMGLVGFLDDRAGKAGEI